MKKALIFLIVLLIILIISAGTLLAMRLMNIFTIIKESNDNDNKIISLGVEEVKKEEKIIKTFNGNSRPIAVMIDNHNGALPQAGLNDAYIVYEIIVEGSETRLMAVFKDKDLSKIGPIRSSRHYFLDYALENDAIYVHYGWSPQAQADIKKLKVSNINGIVQGKGDFWRVKDKKSPHNAVTSTAKILEMCNEKKYRTTSSLKSVLNYSLDEVNLENGIDAKKIEIPYLNEITYIYNEETKRYTRYSNDKKQTDWDTKEDITTKNIIIDFIRNYTLKDTENKGRQGLNNIGESKGYYITNGKAIEITATKTARNEQTVYKDLDGNEINVNDGNTFIQICPINSKVVIE